MPRFRSILSRRPWLASALLCLSGTVTLPAAGVETPAFAPAQLEFFENKVRPILAEHCYSCHGPQKQNNGLRLDSRAAVLRGSDYGPVAVTGNPAGSKLIQAVSHAEGVEAMPKKAGKLPPEAIAALTDWVQQGLPWPEESAPAAAVEDWKKHWAFQPVKMPPQPPVRNAALVQQPLDSYLLARLEKEGLEFSPMADRAALARRAHLDLTGLPPTYAEVRAFQEDASPDAWPKLVDRLLASPEFGERWARRWMDIARYADTKGYVFQEERKYAFAYTYRDWLVNAFNRDLPYDQFVLLQIAADRVTDWEKEPQDLAAMGFLTLGRRFLNSEPDIIDDRLDVVFRGTQALTVSCARCHDHKFDPIPTADYYSLYGVFASSREPDDKPLVGQPEESDAFRAYRTELARRELAVNKFRQQFAPDRKQPLPNLSLLRPYQEKPPLNRKHRTALRELINKVEELKANNPAAPPRAMVMVDKPQPVEPVIFLRGNPGRPGPQVPRRFLKAISPEPDRPAFSQGSGRLEMARAIASPQNPLTARVWVNRVWTWLMGSPLVDTPSDFGVRTAPPLHPELLDHLAARFMEEKWSTKQLVRTILLSSAWQQSSQTSPGGAAKDPENHWYWRQNRRRLDFEALRDSLLAVSGNLNRTRGGRGEEMVTGAGPSRRTLYGLVDRQNLPGLFRTFDFASPDATAPKRFETTVPQQALYMMNSPFVTAQAEKLVEGKTGAGDAALIRQLYQAVLSRDPDPEEVTLGMACLQDLSAQPRQTGTAWQNGWGSFDPAGPTVQFTAFPWFGKDRWSASFSMPDPALGYLQVRAAGGHPGAHAGQSAIRRWVANAPAVVNISVKVRLPSPESSGITAFVMHSRFGLCGTWTVPPGGEVEANLPSLAMEPGDQLDFILDPQGDPSSDSFEWAPVLRDATNGMIVASAAGDFGGPGASALAAYAQVLLCSNEFLYLD